MIQDIVDQVRSQLSPEDLGKVGSFLEQIKNEAQELYDSKKASDSESKNRKIKIREQDEQIQNLQIDNDKLKKEVDSFSTEEIEKERNLYKEKLSAFVNKERDAFSQWYNKVKEHPHWEKAKDEFIIPKKDDKEDWESLKEEDLEKNLASRNRLEKLEYFKADIKAQPAGDKFADIKTKDIASIYELRTKYGANSPQYQEALIKHKRGN